ncbi:PREDICTED: putative SWI/SNF-related matrix-associated actin-dependent regulator of chromatin subfamily A member 3-like 1 [Camelina sativa]|uniref:SWI/SNF-related matrix-associated actin-dependent regulator of chromatin subfamily A member 3-like 1 n=1 Tax=Camelina sativa TaxID=90675 RepID=A0ABM0ZF37_CAMSA|nr:PREDICTED: putative SWI/SNF-related matrix-associated actin-dependent regulator of chromatin subfamily A member 3-like 1 [Camelina sativa]
MGRKAMADGPYMRGPVYGLNGHVLTDFPSSSSQFRLSVFLYIKKKKKKKLKFLSTVMANEDEFQSSTEDLSQQSQDFNSETYMAGFVIANIVGLQYYSGRINGREMVGLVREPLNQYDKNAIRVLNTRSVQVGHIERAVAAVLSPLLDSHMIVAEGIVPNTRSNSNRFKIPCQIHVFAKVEALPVVKSTISRAGLVLISDSDPSFGLSEAVVVKELMGNGGEKKKSSVDKVFKLVDENVRQKERMVSVEPPREVIKSELFAHQKEGLGWLLHREKSGELPPFWEEKDGEFLNVLTNYRSDKRPESLRGGVFADDMGLGKTLTLLSLIAFDRFGYDATSTKTEEPVEVVQGDKKGKKRGRGKSSESVSKKKRISDDVNVSQKKTTLIVCPPSVFSAWITQLEEHTVPGSLRVYMYHGGERTDDVNELMKYDIVLTTYGTLAVEESWDDSPVKKMEWLRIILDEAHTIKNANAQQSRAVSNLKASRRWAVTGTPIQNGSFDLYSLMAFLRFEPFSIKSYWQSLIQRPLGQGNKKGLSRLQVLMATISLRRTKEQSLIGLPSKSVETCYVELSHEERQLYDHMEGEAKGVVRNLINNGSLMRNYSTVLSIILRLRQLCDDLSLCPPELRSFTASISIEDVTDKPELLQKLVAVLQDGEDFDCPICISPPKDIIITRCAHIFCRACILQTLERTKPACPLCRGPLTQSDLYNAPPTPPSDTSNTDGEDTKASSNSSKVSALLSLLIASRQENPNTKSVVFSQFRKMKMLLLLEKPLKAAGFTILRLDGAMTVKKRTQVIGEFGNPELTGPVVLLASLKASGAGINLTAASRVYLFDPWWNPAVEEQAMDRIHRIGQKQEVKMIRMIARNSIEERVLELQQKKKNLANEAFKRKRGKDQREVNVEDVIALMSL